MRQAQNMVDFYDYAGAMTLLETAITKAKTINPEAVDLLAYCYRMTGEMEKAERTYNRLITLSNYDPIVHKQYGEILVYFGKYVEAKDQFRKYLAVASNDPLVEKLITTCDTAMRWSLKRDSSVFRVVNGEPVNTKYNDFGATPLKDGRNIIFYSDRAPSKGTRSNVRPYRSRHPVPDETGKIPRITAVSQYASYYPDYNLGPLVYTKDGRKVYYTRNSDEKSRVTNVLLERKWIMEEASIVNGNITKATPFPFNKPSAYSVFQPCLNPEENVIYFASDMPGGYGGIDLYFSIRSAKGEWSDPVNLGPEINTVGNEVFPTMDENGVLYFSSNGHPGYGNLDIFRAKGEKNKWIAVENLRAPVNSGGDDYFLVFNSGMESGYLASNRGGGSGSDDIYSFTLSGPLPDFGYIEAPKQYIREVIERVSYVHDEVTDTPIEGVLLCFIEKKINNPMYVTSKADGSFEIALEEETDYTLSAIKNGYVPVVNFEFRTGDEVAMQRFRIDLVMTPQVRQQRDRDGDAIIDESMGLYRDPEGDEDSPYNKGITYTVQVLANKSYPDWTYLDKAKETYPQYKIYYGSFPDAFTRFTVGRFRQLREANQLRSELRSIGYTDCFVVMFVDGKRKVVAYH